MLKYMGDKDRRILHRIINLTWKRKIIPEYWKFAIILPLHKKRVHTPVTRQVVTGSWKKNMKGY